MPKTGKEARLKICPQHLTSGDINTCSHGCVAEKCMAWRWAAVIRRSNTSGTEPGVGFQVEEIPIDERKGYCGLAGKPIS